MSQYYWCSWQEYLDRRKMTEFGSTALVDTEGDEGQEQALSLPGVKTGDMSSRYFKPEVNVSCVRFSATGRFCNSWYWSLIILENKGNDVHYLSKEVKNFKV